VTASCSFPANAPSPLLPDQCHLLIPRPAPVLLLLGERLLLLPQRASHPAPPGERATPAIPPASTSRSFWQVFSLLPSSFAPVPGRARSAPPTRYHMILTPRYGALSTPMLGIVVKIFFGIQVNYLL
jgi:hypothetical protein